MPFWAMNGVGLSLLIPTAQSLIADYNPPEQRGKAFGLLFMTGALGALLGALYATNVGHLHPLGVEGWRFAFLTVAVASWAIAGLTLLLAVDPRYTRDERYRVQSSEEAEPGAGWRTTLQEIGRIVTIPTFLVIILQARERSPPRRVLPMLEVGCIDGETVNLLTGTHLQGIVGSVPGQALVFLTLYFQLLGMSDFAASLLLAVFLAAVAAGVRGARGDEWAAGFVVLMVA